MVAKKICMLGAFSVGKTSLVARFVESVFSEKYLTTVGVKVDKKVVQLEGQEVKLMLWDLAGEDDFGAANLNYLKGASGYLLVMDGTRRATLDTAQALSRRIEEQVGRLPFVALLNKADLRDEWEFSAQDVTDITILETSAKTGQGVEEAFLQLTRAMLT